MPGSDSISWADVHRHVFKKSVLWNVKLHEILKMLGPVRGQACLDIGTPNGMVSYYLRQHGGEWTSVATDPIHESVLKELVGNEVYRMEGHELPFKKKVFDTVLVIDSLERIPADAAFVEECHRVLKPTGRLIVNVLHRKPFSLIRLIQRVLRVRPEDRGCVRAGYTEADLFGILKHGFDVLAVRSYGRFWVLLVDSFVEFAERRAANVASVPSPVMKAYGVAGPFYRVAHQMDSLLFLTRGHFLLASAKRRLWRPREAPVLGDGRSITEAVLTRAGR